MKFAFFNVLFLSVLVLAKVPKPTKPTNPALPATLKYSTEDVFNFVLNQKNKL